MQRRFRKKKVGNYSSVCVSGEFSKAGPVEKYVVYNKFIILQYQDEHLMLKA